MQTKTTKYDKIIIVKIKNRIRGKNERNNRKKKKSKKIIARR